MLKLFSCISFVILCLSNVKATDISVSNVEIIHSSVDELGNGISFLVSWDNSWRNKKNHDAAWVFFKFLNDNGSQHAYLKPKTASLLWKDENHPDAELSISEDGTGLIISADSEYRGTLSYRVFAEIDTSKVDYDRYINLGYYENVKGFGIEMVYIPEAPFTLGDPSPLALREASFYKSDNEGNYNGLFEITASDQEIPVGKSEGQLFYQSQNPAYQGDQKGPIPSSFPNGYPAFYLMKYEIRQGIYADFLNSINNTAQAHRVVMGSLDYTKFGGSITIKNGEYKASHPNRRNIYMNWNDMMAFMDWAGLRPYTEFEYTKACRGNLKPKELEYPWNTSSAANMLNRIDPVSHEQKMLNGLDESRLTEDNYATFGASYYWVMDLSGSMWEKVITVGDSVGRSYTGKHGDGQLDYLGFADTEGWPEGNRESYGYGYRGGGYYGKADVYKRNPYNRIAFRNYGSWSGGPRKIAYGSRGARTAPKNSK